MCLRRRTWRMLGRYFLIALSVVLLRGSLEFADAVWAQSQEYINGQTVAQLKALEDRVGNLEKVQYFVLATILGVLITNLMGLRNQGIDRKYRHSQDDERQQRYQAEDRVIERRLRPRPEREHLEPSQFED